MDSAKVPSEHDSSLLGFYGILIIIVFLESVMAFLRYRNSLLDNAIAEREQMGFTPRYAVKYFHQMPIVGKMQATLRLAIFSCICIIFVLIAISVTLAATSTRDLSNQAFTPVDDFPSSSN